MQIDRCHIVGTSFGGLIAQIFAAKHTGRVQSLILTNTACNSIRVSEVHIEHWIDLLRNNDLASFLKSLKGLCYSHDFLVNQEKYIDEKTESLFKLPRKPFKPWLNFYWLQACWYPWADKKNCLPTYILAGEDDYFTPAVLSREIHELIPVPVWSCLQRQVDASPVERPDLIAGLIHGFVSANSLERWQVVLSNMFHCTKNTAFDGQRDVQVSAGLGPSGNVQKVLHALDLRSMKDKSVLIKPNLGRNVPPAKGITTHPDAIKATIEVLKDLGVKKIAIGESPFSEWRCRRSLPGMELRK